MKEIKLTKVTPWKETELETYEAAIKRHLKEMSPELKGSSPNVLMVLSMSELGMSYHVLSDNTSIEVIGALEVLKSYFMVDHLGD